MLTMPKNMNERYSPLYFLASVGAGGLTISFFMYLMFWVPHPGRPVPEFEDIAAYLGSATTLGQATTIFAMVAIAYFAYLNIRFLLWNLSEFSKFKKTDAYINHQKTNAQTQVKAQALALAMTINVGFILGLVFVPNLWSVVEYLFPLAIIAFLAVGVLAFRNLGQFLSRVLVEGGFDRAGNNSFAQLLPSFAFSMVGVGLAAPAAMSTVKATVAISLVASTFFLVTSVILMSIAVVLGVAAMMKHGAGKETSPTLLVVIPIMTVLGILVLRQDHGMYVVFDSHTSSADTLKFLAMLLSIQVVFALLGIMVMRAQKYVSHYITGTDKSAGSYALICPGVGFSVLFQFFINKGLVANGIVDKYSLVYWMFTAVAIASQMAMVWLLFKLNNKHFGSDARQPLVAAE